MILVPISNPPILENTTYHYCIEFEWQEYDNLFFSTRGISLPADMEEEVPKRKAHFLGGRYCAHQALEMMQGNVELYTLTKDIRDNFSKEVILQIFEYMWSVVLSDGKIDDFEAALMSKLVWLFHLTGKESADAKKKAMSHQ